MVTPSKSLIQESLFDSVNEWLQTMCDSVSVAAGEAYAAGNFHAVGQLRAGLSFDVVQKDALEYAKTYRDNLVKKGEIQVSRIQYGPDGLPLLNKNGTIKRADETIQWLQGSEQKISNDLADIIQRGIMEGKATGVRQLASGGYPAGSIAEEINQYLSGYKSRASTIARTETARNYYHGEQSRYAKAGVKYVQYLGAPDACEECQPYIKQVFELGTEPALPIHPNCRCDYRPLSPNDADYPDEVYEEDKLELPEGWDADLIEPEITMPVGDMTTRMPAEVEIKSGLEYSSYGIDIKQKYDSIDLYKHQIRTANPVIPYDEVEEITKIPTIMKTPESLSNGVLRYTSNDYKEVNSVLRRKEGYEKGGRYISKGYFDYLETEVKEVDKFINGNTVAKKIELRDGSIVDCDVLFRGIRGNSVKRIANLKEGELFTDGGYMSFTYKEDYAVDFADAYEKSKVVFKINVQEGMRGGYIGEASAWDNEGEILIGRGEVFIVKKRIERKVGDENVLFIELIPAVS